MTIDVPGVPQGTLVPFMWISVEPSPSPLSAIPRVLLINNRVGGTATNLKQYLLGDTIVEQLFGRASPLAQMYRHARKVSPIGEIWGISFGTDPDADVYATAELDFSNPANKAGVCTISIGEEDIRVVVPAGSTAADMALLVKKKINGNQYCAFSAVVETTTSKLLLTCKWRGTSGNKILITTKDFGRDQDYAKYITVTQPNGGVGGHDIDACLTALNDQGFDIICSGFSNDNAIEALGDFLDGDTGRWSPAQQIYGHGVVGAADTVANLVTLGGSFNDPHVTVLGHSQAKSPEWCWAAELAAQMQVHYASPPELSRPLQTLPLPGIKPNFKDDLWFTPAERQSLYEAGIACTRIDQYRNILIDRDVTLYKTNVWGDLDASWRDATTMFQTMYFVRYMRAAITGAYPRAALSDKDTGINGFASPGQVKDTLIHAYAELQLVGLVENLDLFAKVLQVERDPEVATRMNILLPPDFVNQWRIAAVLVQTHLQLTSADMPAEA
jgi:phage tail sheath gpL-like